MDSCGFVANNDPEMKSRVIQNVQNSLKFKKNLFLNV